MIDIGVYTDRMTLEDKKRYSKDFTQYTWWNLPEKPKRGDVNRIFFATDGRWQGYFTVKRIEPKGVSIKTPKYKYSVFLHQWHELSEKMKRTPFRGYTYDVPDIGGKD